MLVYSYTNVNLRGEYEKGFMFTIDIVSITY